jgi:hypothetical protein
LHCRRTESVALLPGSIVSERYKKKSRGVRLGLFGYLSYAI